MSAKTFFLLLALTVAYLVLKELFTKRRLYSCMNGHVPRVETTAHTGKILLVCPHRSCGEATHLHVTVDDAIKEWNSLGAACWKAYDVRWWHQLIRWWRGCFYE